MKRIFEPAPIGNFGNRQPSRGKQTRPPFHPDLPEIASRCHRILLPEKPDKMLRGYPCRPRCLPQAILLPAVFLQVIPGAVARAFPLGLTRVHPGHARIFLEKGETERCQHVLPFFFTPRADTESCRHEKLESLRLGLHGGKLGQTPAPRGGYGVGMNRAPGMMGPMMARKAEIFLPPWQHQRDRAGRNHAPLPVKRDDRFAQMHNDQLIVPLDARSARPAGIVPDIAENDAGGDSADAHGRYVFDRRSHSLTCNSVLYL